MTTNTTTNKKLALDAQRENLWLLNPEDIVIPGIDTDDGPEHPLVNHRVERLRRDGPTKEMIDSLIAEGQQQPIVVRKNGERVECVLGRNRTLAMRAANIILSEAGQDAMKIRAVLRKNNDDGGLTGAIEAENAVRRDDDMLTKARNAQRLLDRGQEKRDVARRMGMSVEVLDNHLRVLELSPKMQSAVERGVITATAAATFADMAHEEQDKKIAEAEAMGIIITVPEARRQKKQRGTAKKGGAKSEVATRGKGVAISVLRKVYDDAVFVDQLDQTAKALLRWVIGEGSHRTVGGLGAALRRAGELTSDE